MNYEFITTIATILLVGASIAGFILQAIKSMSRSTDARFDRVDKRFEKIDQRLDRFDERFYAIQKEFVGVHAAIARLEGKIEGIRASQAATLVPGVERQA